MFRIIKEFFKDKNAAANIIVASELWMAAAVGAACLVLPLEHVLNSRVHVTDVAKQIFTYSAIGLGSCMSGIAMTVRLVDGDFISFVKEGALVAGQPKSKLNRLPRALFAISWTAFCHWLTLMVCLCVIGLVDTETPLFDSKALAGGRFAPALILFLFTYDVLQFLSSILLIAIIGRRYTEFLQARRADSATENQP